MPTVLSGSTCRQLDRTTSLSLSLLRSINQTSVHSDSFLGAPSPTHSDESRPRYTENSSPNVVNLILYQCHNYNQFSCTIVH